MLFPGCRILRRTSGLLRPFVSGAIATMGFSWHTWLLALLAPVGLAIYLYTKPDDSMASPQDWKNASSVYDFTVRDIKGQEVSLEKYKGHVLLIVNVASKCGLTATNYKELVELHDKYAQEKGLRILAFPCNQFGSQEPGSSEDIVCFAMKQNAKFDLFEKIDVNGDNAHPLYKYLKHKQGGTLVDFIKWNFTKFIVDKNGQPVERHGPNVDPSKLVSSLEKYW